MTISMYSASVPVFRQMLNSLSDILQKAEAHASAKSFEPTALLQARLFPDMFNLISQVRIACDFAKNVSLRLARQEMIAFEDNEQTFADLQARISKTLALLDGLNETAFAGSEELEIVLRPGTPKERKMTGQQHLLAYGLPQFFFHVTTAYALLRHNGVELGKKDFVGNY